MLASFPWWPLCFYVPVIPSHWGFFKLFFLSQLSWEFCSPPVFLPNEKDCPNGHSSPCYYTFCTFWDFPSGGGDRFSSPSGERGLKLALVHRMQRKLTVCHLWAQALRRLVCFPSFSCKISQVPCEQALSGLLKNKRPWGTKVNRPSGGHPRPAASSHPSSSVTVLASYLPEPPDWARPQLLTRRTVS